MSSLKGVSAVLALLVLGLFAYGCGGDDGATQEQLDAAKAEGAKEARQQARLNQLQGQVKQLQKQSKQSSNGNSGKTGGQGDGYYQDAGSDGGPVSTCATGVQVGPNTSCSFAMNVAGEYGSNPGATTITALSPVTGTQYTLSCSPWSGGGHVCTGGNNASIYLP